METESERTLLDRQFRGPLTHRIASNGLQDGIGPSGRYSTVTDLARFRGLSTSWPRSRAAW